MNIYHVVAVLSVLLIAGCQRPQGSIASAGPQVKPGLIMIPRDQVHLYAGAGECTGHVAAPTATPMDVGSVQSQSDVSVIQFNRYPDPARPRELMHEAHIVYRRENNPRWKLQPTSRNHQILIGPAVTDGRGEIQPLASQELGAFMQEQRANAQQQQQLVMALADGVRRLATQQEQLAQELGSLKSAEPQESGGSADKNETTSPARQQNPE